MTNSSRVAIFSDIHLGVHQNSIFWHSVALKWCDWFVTELDRHNIDTVLFLGDYFDHRDEIANNTLDVGYQIMSKLQRFKLIMIPGNHDSFYKEHADVNSLKIFSGWNNVRLLNDISSIDFGNTSATFVPWGGDIDQVRWTPYLFGHFAINTFSMNGSKVCTKGVDVDKIASLSPQVFSGHFHKRDVRVYDASTITYVGNTFETSFGETDCTKGYHILNFDTGSLEFFPNPISPKHVKMYVTDILKVGNIPSDVKGNIKGNIVRLYVDKFIPPDVIDALQAKVKIFEPAQSSVEFLTTTATINIDDAIRDSDLSDISVDKAIEEFVSFLEVPNKEKIREMCLAFHTKCK